jgi:hypothetical protein
LTISCAFGAAYETSTTSSGTMPPTSLGMRYGCFTHAATRNWERSEVEADARAMSKMSTSEPNTSYTMEIDQVGARRFSIEMSNL